MLWKKGNSWVWNLKMNFSKLNWSVSAKKGNKESELTTIIWTCNMRAQWICDKNFYNLLRYDNMWLKIVESSKGGTYVDEKTRLLTWFGLNATCQKGT